MKKYLFAFLMLILCSTFSDAQMAKFQALYIFQFAKNTSWPQEDAGKPLVVTVVGDNALSTELKAIVNNKRVGDRPIKVVDAATSSGLPKSDIIYLERQNHRRFLRWWRLRRATRF